MNLSPLPIQKFFGNNGRPLNGGKLFTYVAGTTTKVATYTDSSGGTPNTNPIILDFRGECRLWIDPTLTYKFVLSPPLDSDPPTNPIWTVDNITVSPQPFDNTAVATGTANAISLSIPRISSPVAFTRVIFKALFTNTGPTTLQINGGTAHPITWQNIGAFAGGEIQANGFYEVVFDGAQWQIQGPTLQPPQMKTAAETTAGAVIVNYAYLPGQVYRYGTNTTPGVTDMTAALNTAANVCRAGNYVLQLPPETCFVTSTLDFTGIRVVGTISHAGTNYHIQASSAQFDVIRTDGNSVFADFAVHGGWNGVTAGLSGDTFSFVSPVFGFCYNIHMTNVNVNFNKRRAIYWETPAYSHLDHVDSSVSGLHGLEIIGGIGAGHATTVTIDGQSRFSDCPNGYSVKLTECISIGFDGCIMENSNGIQLNGGSNRAISFTNVYQENAVGLPLGTLFIDGAGSAGSGLSVTSCYGASKSIANVTGWENVFFSGNSAITLPAIPLTGRITLTDGGQQTTNTTGGVNVTSAQVLLAAGTYLMWGTVQTLAGTGSNLLQSGCVLTGDVAGAGLNNATDANFRPGADEQTFNPGGGMDHRLSCFNVIQLTAPTTIYLRTYLNYSGAGSMTYHGAITSVLLS